MSSPAKVYEFPTATGGTTAAGIARLIDDLDILDLVLGPADPLSLLDYEELPAAA